MLLWWITLRSDWTDHKSKNIKTAIQNYLIMEEWISFTDTGWIKFNDYSATLRRLEEHSKLITWLDQGQRQTLESRCLHGSHQWSSCLVCGCCTSRCKYERSGLPSSWCSPVKLFQCKHNAKTDKNERRVL